MRKQTRPPEPNVLRENAAKWHEAWKQKAAAGKTSHFSWYEARELIVLALRELHQEHCSFCDCHPLADRSNKPIEHFRPKSRYHGEAYDWANLYYICEACNTAKHDQFEDELLRPDLPDYEWGDYFDFDYTNGAMRPNPAAEKPAQSRAECAIRLYDRDNPDRRRCRRLELRKWRNSSERRIDEWAYRDYLERE